MKKKHDGKRNIMIFDEGDFATLVIPSDNRTPLDAKQIVVKIIKVLRANIYTLQC